MTPPQQAAVPGGTPGDDTDQHPRPGIGATLLLIVGAVVYMALFFRLFAAAGVRMPYFGLLFLVYWGAILKQRLATFGPTVVGAATGIVLGWSLVTAPVHLGTPGVALSAVVVAALLFCFMRRSVGWVVNDATMLFLTVATIRELDVGGNVAAMIASLLLGAAYMGGIAFLVDWIRRRSARRAGKAPADLN